MKLTQDSTGAMIDMAYGAVGTGIAMMIKEVSITCATDALITDSSNFFPANASPIALVLHVTTSIGNGGYITKIGTSGSDDIMGGGAGDGGAFADNLLEQDGDTITINGAFNGSPFASAGGSAMGLNAAQTLRLTHAAQPDAGVVRAILYYWQITPATS